MRHVATGGFEGQNPLDNVEDVEGQGHIGIGKRRAGMRGGREKKTEFLREEYRIFVGALYVQNCSEATRERSKE